MSATAGISLFLHDHRFKPTIENEAGRGGGAILRQYFRSAMRLGQEIVRNETDCHFSILYELFFKNVFNT